MCSTTEAGSRERITDSFTPPPYTAHPPPPPPGVDAANGPDRASRHVNRKFMFGIVHFIDASVSLKYIDTNTFN